MNSPILFLGAQWKNVSQDAKNLVLQMLKKSQGERVTAQKALDHAWFAGMN